jgi:hypothetical protein
VKHVVGNEGKYTSQSNEDEIIADIFSKIGVGKKTFFEFGSGDGQQNNTIALLLQGWSGVWLEPHKRRCRSAKQRYAGYPNLKIHRRNMTTRNVNKWITDKIDFLSIDIDGEDYAVWKAMTARPRVVCIEYDELVGTARKAGWRGTPLETTKQLGEEKGYRFYGCSASNVNAFFIRQENENG